MNRDIRRRQQRQARLAKNADAIARRQGATPKTATVAPTPGSWVDRLRSRNAIVAAVVLAVVVAAGAWFFLLRGGPDTSDLNVTTFEDQGREHLAEGEENPNFNSNPPTSGSHAPTNVPWGVYTLDKEPFPTKEQLVHNMEHGGAIVWYDPDALTADQVDQLTKEGARLVRDKRMKVVVVPWKDLDTAVALTAWTKLAKLDGFDLDKIRRFVEAFEGPGPENVPFTSPVILPPGY